MRILGVTITRKQNQTLAPVDSRGGWWPWIREVSTGAWQTNTTVDVSTVFAHATIFACITSIAADIAKMALRLVAVDDDDIWTPTYSPAFSPVIETPNRYQNRIEFVEQWITSKLAHGNTYVLKERDGRGVVRALYILDPQRVTPLVAEDGSVWYQLARDTLADLPQTSITVPAREIIHDRINALFHPLVGLSPIYAAGLAATVSLRIQDHSSTLFGNAANPGGVLTAPGAISDSVAARLKAYWDANYTGANRGKVAVLGDGLKYEQMAMTAVDAQVIDQLKFSAEQICSTFHMPAYMVGAAPPPNYNNIQALSVQYFTQCLHSLVEHLELCLDRGLELPHPYGTEFDVDDLLRMDSATQMQTVKEGVGAGVLKPNEGRAKLGLKPVQGGDTPYLQIQNYSLAALDRRDTMTPPPTSPVPTSPNADTPMPPAQMLNAADVAMLATKAWAEEFAA